MALKDLISVLALVLAVAGFVLGVMNYLRDRHRVVVTLAWDLDASDGSGLDQTRQWGVITVTNVGRRSTYVSHVALKLPPGHDASHLLIMQGLHGQKLTEGDPTVMLPIDQEGMEAYSKDWRKIVAQVSDSTGKVWYSKRLKTNQVPSWARRNDT